MTLTNMNHSKIKLLLPNIGNDILHSQVSFVIDDIYHAPTNQHFQVKHENNNQSSQQSYIGNHQIDNQAA